MSPLPSRFTRRKFLWSSALLASGALLGDAFLLEPHHLRVSNVTLSAHPTTRFVVWSDFHYSGNREYADRIVETINAANPQFVCFLGDLVDQLRFQEEALEFIGKIRFPVFGVPGNHDYSCHTSFALNRVAFGATGGAWMVNKLGKLPGIDLEIFGSAERFVGFIPQFSKVPRILLTHYPITARETNGKLFSGIFAGHSHGGQIRLPLIGPITLPKWVGRYDMGQFSSPGGPLYVTQGVGTFRVPARFNCPPEVAVVEV